MSEDTLDCNDVWNRNTCWQCRHLILDISGNGRVYKCVKLGKILKDTVAVNGTTECKNFQIN